MFHKNTRALAVLFMLSLFATASFAQGGTAASGKDATATKKSKIGYHCNQDQES